MWSSNDLLLIKPVMCFQPSTRYAVDAEPSIRSMPTATVYGKRSVAFTGGDCADTKVHLYAFILGKSCIKINIMEVKCGLFFSYLTHHLFSSTVMYLCLTHSFPLLLQSLEAGRQTTAAALQVSVLQVAKFARYHSLKSTAIVLLSLHVKT